MKSILRFVQKLAPVLVLVGIGIILGIILTTLPVLAQYTLPKIDYLKSIARIIPNDESIDDKSSTDKKKSLELFYQELSEAESQANYEKLYLTVNPSDKKWFTYEDFRLVSSNNQPVSIEYIVHNMSVDKNIGTVDRTIITCSTKQCSGSDKSEQRGLKEYLYIDGQWYQQSSKEPSEKARKLTAYMYTNSSTKKRQELAKRYADGIDDNLRIIRTWSIILENNPELMAYDEALVEKHKIEASKTEVYVDAPSISQQPIIQQPAPAVQQQISPTHCTSNTIGRYTYTNCY